MSNKFIDLTGQVFGRLTVLSFSHYDKHEISAGPQEKNNVIIEDPVTQTLTQKSNYRNLVCGGNFALHQ